MSHPWFSLVLLIAGFQHSHGTSVNTSHRYAVVGRHPVEITCSYSVDDDEAVQYVYIDTYSEDYGFVELVTFWPDNGTAAYTEHGRALENRSTPVLGVGSVGLRLDAVECGDAGEYYCNVQTNVSYTYDWMQLFVAGITTKPQILVAKAECLDEGEDLELVCVGVFANALGSFVWYGYHPDQETANLTDLADPGVPYGDEHCSYKMASHLKLSLTPRDRGMVIRCASSDAEIQIAPSASDECDEFCDESLPVSFAEHLARPTLSVQRTTNCNVDQVHFRCSGKVGDHEGHFLWFAYRPGQAPQTLTGRSHSTVPAKTHGSCGYQRESTLELELTKGDNGLEVRCTLHDSPTAHSPTAEDPCGDYCAQTDQIPVTDLPSCTSSTSGGTELLCSVLWLISTILFHVLL